MRARRNHGLHIFELQRAVLHFKPRVVVVFGRLAIAGDIELGLREAENLLAFQKLLLDRVVQLRLRGLVLRLRKRQHAKRNGQE